MKLFAKRPLSLILCIMLGGFYFSNKLTQTGYVIAAGASIGATLAILILRDLFKSRKVLLVICSVALFISIALSYLWSVTFLPREHFDNTVAVSGIVTDANHKDGNRSKIVLRTDEIDGRRDSHTILVYGSKEELSGVNIGDEITVTLTLKNLAPSGSKSYSKYYYSKGYSAISYDPKDISIESRGNFTIGYYFDQIRQWVSDQFRINTNKETGDFLSALITGEREALHPATDLTFTRIGISHILALSGAHLVILAYAVNSVLRLLKLNNKVRTVIVVVFVVLYMLLTGMSSSVTRAGVMLIVTSTLYLLSHKSDPFTSLVISVAIIIAFQPHAIFDVSLWLSAFATIGLIFLTALTRRDSSADKLPKRILYLLRDSTLASVFAISASLVISICVFDSFSALAVPATLIFSPLTELLIYLGLVTLAIGRLVPIGSILVFLTDMIKQLASEMSKFDFALISMEFPILKLLAALLITSLIIFLLFGDAKKGRGTIIVITILFVSLNLVGVACSAMVKNEDAIDFYPDALTNSVMIKSNGEVAVITVGTSYNSSYVAAEIISNERLTTLDSLIITSYNKYTPTQVEATVSSIMTKRIYLPTPTTSDELMTAEHIATILSEYPTLLTFYKDEEAIRIGEVDYQLIARRQSTSIVREEAYILRYDKKIVTFITEDALDSINQRIRAVVDACDTLIVGAPSENFQVKVELAPKNAKLIILGGNFAPTKNMDTYTTKNGVSVEITDTPIRIFD